MTQLDRPVVRKTSRAFMHYRKPLVLALQPGDTLAIRLLKHSKRVVVLDLHHLYFEGVRRQVAQEKAAKKRKTK